MKIVFRPSEIVAGIVLLACLTPAGPLQASSVLDIGTDYRLRAISFGKADFGSTGGQDYSYFSDRAEAYVGGHFSPNIEMMVQFQALEIVGASSSTLASPTVTSAASRYPNTSFAPWVQ